MPPIPIYNKSPINANKASGVTPQTAAPAEVKGGGLGGPPPAAATTTVHPTKTLGYAQARPGAVPSIPAPTGAAGGVGASAVPAPTATATLQSLRGGGGSPPAPQPGAVPAPEVQASRTAPVAPPLKAGGKYRLSTPGPEATPAPQLGQTHYPPQMSVSPPQVPLQQRGTMAASGTSGSASQLPSVSSIQTSSHPNRDLDRDSSLEHPPGYRQKIDESPGFGSLHQYHQQHGHNGSGGQEDEGEGVWDAAKKFVQAAGEKLAVAEGEVWKRINKG